MRPHLGPFVRAATAVLLLASTAAAHPREYVNLTGDAAWLPNCEPEGLAQGAICFPAGHIVPDDQGEATISISDDLVSPASAFHCVDLDQDLVCSEDRDLIETFCGSHVMTVGEDWDGVSQIVIFLDGPVFGNPLNSACGTLSAATHGWVSHS